MYQPPYYTNNDKGVCLDYIRQFPLGNLIIPTIFNQPEITIIPFLIESEDPLVLSGHIMSAASHYQNVEFPTPVTIIFNGPSGYISAAWYENPQQGSTWNYTAVIVHGRMYDTGKEGALKTVKDLTNHFEPQNSQASFENLPQNYIEGLLPYINGIRIEVENLNGIFKLSQNKTPQEVSSIIQHLEQRNQKMDALLIEWMKKFNK